MPVSLYGGDRFGAFVGLVPDTPFGLLILASRRATQLRFEYREVKHWYSKACPHRCREGWTPLLRCGECHRPMEGSTEHDGACECGGLIERDPGNGWKVCVCSWIQIHLRTVGEKKYPKNWQPRSLRELLEDGPAAAVEILREEGKLGETA